MILKQRYERPFSDLANDVENIIEQVFGDCSSGSGTCAWSPRTNVFENETSYTVELELPGVEPGDVNVELKDGHLEISGEKSVETEVEGRKVLKSERRTGAFRRSFKFTSQLDADNILASFKHGILTVELPKSEKVLPRKIEVKVAE